MNAPETEEAAVKIQAAFRGHQVRKEMSDEKNAVSVPSLNFFGQSISEVLEPNSDVNCDSQSVKNNFKGYFSLMNLYDKSCESPHSIQNCIFMCFENKIIINQVDKVKA